jgi:hypothetical protein
MARRLNPPHDRVQLTREELHALEQLERSLAAGAPPEPTTGRRRRLRGLFRRRA